MKDTSERRLLVGTGLLFFASGASSLAYEVAWVKILSLQFGSSAWSIATVIAGFMAGLGSGSAWAGRRCDRIRHPVRVYALLELGIALFGLSSIYLLGGLGWVYGPLYRFFQDQFSLFVLVRFLLSFACLLVPTFLMGASLPVLVVGLAGEKTFSQRVALFYGINTLGGAAGVMLAGFFTMPVLGITGTLLAAVTVGLLVAVGGFVLDRCVSGGIGEAAERVAPERTKAPTILLGALAMAGCLSIAYQLAWTRLLIPIVGSSTYAFSIILTTFLVGLGLGALLPATPLGRGRGTFGGVGLAMALTSLTVLAGLFPINHLPDLFQTMLKGTQDRTWLLFFWQGAITGSIILLPTLFMGATVPLAIAGCRRVTKAPGESIGGIYAANTLGAIVGSLLTGFVLLPAMGAGGTIRLASVVGLGVALLLLLFHQDRVPWRSRLLGTGTLTLLLFVELLSLPAVDIGNLHRGVFRTVQALSTTSASDAEMVYAREGQNATVTVFRSPDDTVLKVNGKADASTRSDVKTQYLVGHLPVFLSKHPEAVCVIGYGSGATVHAVRVHPSVISVDVVEIEQAVVEVSGYFQSINQGVLDDSRVHLHTEDGRTFLRYRPRQYDVIISEPSNPWITGVSSLFTTEFYREVKKRLKPGGRFCQWVQFYEISSQTIRVVISTLAEVFSHAVVFYTNSDLICVASDLPPTADLASVARRMEVPSVRETLDRIQIRNPYELFMSLYARFPEDLELFSSEIHNTDGNLWLEYRAPIEMYQGVGPSLRWITAANYLESMATLLPGVERRELALAAARGMERTRPGLANFIASIAEAFAKEPDTRKELLRLSAAARSRWQAWQQNPQRLAQANRLMREQRFEEAREHLERVLESEPDVGAAHRALAQCFLEVGERDRAMEHFQRAVERQPDDYVSRGKLGWLLLLAENPEGERHLTRALELNPGHAPNWELQILHLVRRGQHDRAAAWLARAEEVLAPPASAWLLGRLDSLLERADAAAGR